MQEQELVIDEEFKSFLPVLDAVTFASLEANIINYGVRDPIVIWNGIIIDGHNRYAICKKHDLPFMTVSMEFPSRDNVLEWIIENQIIRRNLSTIQLSHFRGVLYRAKKRIISNEQGRNQYSEVGGQNDHQPNPQSTANRLAEQHRVSPKTIRRDAKVSEAIEAIGEVSPEAMRMILADEVRIHRTVLIDIASGSKEEIAVAAARIIDGTFENRRFTPADIAPGAGAGSAGDTTTYGSSGSGSSGMNAFETTIARITNELFSELRKHANQNNSAEMKSALRSYINMLEDFYRQI